MARSQLQTAPLPEASLSVSPCAVLQQGPRDHDSSYRVQELEMQIQGLMHDLHKERAMKEMLMLQQGDLRALLKWVQHAASNVPCPIPMHERHEGV